MQLTTFINGKFLLLEIAPSTVRFLGQPVTQLIQQLGNGYGYMLLLPYSYIILANHYLKVMFEFDDSTAHFVLSLNEFELN